MPTRLRLFVALYPPPQVAHAYVTHVASLLATSPDSRVTRGYKLVPEPQVHLTLQFIGDIDPRQLDQTIESVERAAAGCVPLECTPYSLVLQPSQGPVRLIALELSCPPILRELHQRLALRLAKRQASTDFWPHMTLLRFSPANASRDQLKQLIPQSPLQESQWPGFRATSLSLVQSVISDSGAFHRELAKIHLDGH